MHNADKIIEQTKKWIKDVVIGCNFCPFAASVVKKEEVFYRVVEGLEISACVLALKEELLRLDEEQQIETSFLVLPGAVAAFNDYLDLVEEAESMIKQNGYEGIYQLASFHPLYCFADADENDAANYTNRSPYPMLHLLREASIDKSLEHYKDPETIPERNINFARDKGLVYMKILRDTCF